MLKNILPVIGFLALFMHFLCAQISSSTDSSSFVPNINPVIIISHCLNGSINIDGKLNEEVWKNAVIARNFCEIEPGDNIKPSVETEVFITYDDDNLYFGFICYENEIKSLVKRMVIKNDRKPT